MMYSKQVFSGNKNEISSFGIWNKNEFISSSVSGECRIYDARVKSTAMKCILCGKSEDIEKVFAVPLENNKDESIQNKRQAIVVTNDKIMSFDLRASNSIIINNPEKILPLISSQNNNSEISCV